MLQAYSSNIDVSANAAFVLNNVVVDKGCAERLSGPASIELNQRGVYLVEVDGFCSSVTAGDNTAQLFVNGVAQPQAITSYTLVANTPTAFGFKTFIQVAENNCNCNCTSSPTVLQILNGESDLVETHINAVVTKIR